MDEDLCGGLPKELCDELSIEQKIIKIRVEERRFGKAVTIVDGLPDDKEFIKPLLKKLKTTLATGGTFKDGRLELQGDHRHKVKEILVQELGIPPENILIVD